MADNRTDDGTHLRICTGLAPDASSVKAAQALLKPGQADARLQRTAVWGECKGSGAKPYQVEADLSGRSSNAPARAENFLQAFLALLLLRVQQEAAFTQGEAPDWVKNDAREKRAARQEQKQENKGQPADPAAAAKREASRSNAWLPAWTIWALDVRPHTPRPRAALRAPAWQEEAAARMVDAQLPGIAARLRNLQGVTFSGETGPAWCSPSLGSCSSSSTPSATLTHCPGEQADIRAALGLSPDKDEVLATGERLNDLWLVLGVSYAEENKLWRRRVWLRGQNRGRTALLLDFSRRQALRAKFRRRRPCGYDAGLLSGRGSLRAIATGDPVRAQTAPIPTVPSAKR